MQIQPICSVKVDLTLIKPSPLVSECIQEQRPLKVTFALCLKVILHLAYLIFNLAENIFALQS